MGSESNGSVLVPKWLVGVMVTLLVTSIISLAAVVVELKTVANEHITLEAAYREFPTYREFRELSALAQRIENRLIVIERAVR